MRSVGWVSVVVGGLLLAGQAMGAGPVRAADVTATGSVTRQPLPRFVSLKADRVNVRAGPTREHDVTFSFTRSGLPVEIVAEFDTWRRIRDWEGAEGWVHQSLLTGRRTVMVAPRARVEGFPLRDRPAASAATVARLAPGVTGAVRECTGSWCRVTGEGFDGWMEQERLFGVYPNEKVD